MKQSQLFTKTRKESPKDEVAKNAQLLIRAGYIHKNLAGVYSFLPLGLRVMDKIVGIIREEMNAVGGQELFLASLQDKQLWEKTDRWDDAKVDIWFKTKFKSGGDTALAITHEEPITALMSEHISSYRDLPVCAYQFQTKFRNEIRAKSGIMRGKEFLMKDLYSFAKDETEHAEIYAKLRQAYVKIFQRIGIGSITYPTFASGGIFSKFSEEFQTISPVGEDTIYVDEKRGIALNSEVMTDDVIASLSLSRKDLVEKKSIEIGNIFTLGTKFSEPLGLLYTDEAGAKKPVFMGSYGIGPGRVMGSVVEVLADDKGIVWPDAIAPFRAHVIPLQMQSEQVKKEAEKLFKALEGAGMEALYDDRDLRPGEKLSDAELIGIPHIFVVGDKGVTDKVIEYKTRKTLETKRIPLAEIASLIKTLQS